MFIVNLRVQYLATAASFRSRLAGQCIYFSQNSGKLTPNIIKSVIVRIKVFQQYFYINLKTNNHWCRSSRAPALQYPRAHLSTRRIQPRWYIPWIGTRLRQVIASHSLATSSTGSCTAVGVYQKTSAAIWGILKLEGPGIVFTTLLSNSRPPAVWPLNIHIIATFISDLEQDSDQWPH